jgi:hypothetical protein
MCLRQECNTWNCLHNYHFQRPSFLSLPKLLSNSHILKTVLVMLKWNKTKNSILYQELHQVPDRTKFLIRPNSGNVYSHQKYYEKNTNVYLGWAQFHFNPSLNEVFLRLCDAQPNTHQSQDQQWQNLNIYFKEVQNSWKMWQQGKLSMGKLVFQAKLNSQSVEEITLNIIYIPYH